MAGRIGETPGQGTEYNGPDQKAGILPKRNFDDGFDDASKHLGFLNPKRHYLQRAKIESPARGSGRVYVGVGITPPYYAERHSLVIPSGIDSIGASINLGEILATQQAEGLPVFTSAKFDQPAKLPPGPFMDFRGTVEVADGQITGEVVIYNANGDEMARTTDMKGHMEQPKIEILPKPLNLEEFEMPDRFSLAAPELSEIYDPQRFVIHGINMRSHGSGTGLLVVGVDENSRYFVGGHRSHRVPEITLVHGAMQTLTLVGLQEQNPERFRLPFYSAGCFTPVAGVPMGDFVRFVTHAERSGNQIYGQSILLNPEGVEVGRVSDMRGSLSTASVMNTVLSKFSARS